MIRQRRTDLGEAFARANEQGRQKRQVSNVVWLLGAGFSQPLDGPLFADLLEDSTREWVHAWLVQHQVPEDKWPRQALSLFQKGRAKKLWSNAEECLARLDEAATEGMARTVIDRSLGADVGARVELATRELSQFVAVATSFFVDRAMASASLPEVWIPYSDWMSLLTEHDHVVSFNYDRVVEELAKRAKRQPKITKLHGTVPSPERLIGKINDGVAVDSISMPGPNKLALTQGTLAATWKEAEALLAKADRLVVVGYSFPVSDPFARSFVLKHSKAKAVEIVLGPGTLADDLAAMFRRQRVPTVINTGLYSQVYLAEGTARPDGGRFRHWHGA